jgi:hypothetical protein
MMLKKGQEVDVRWKWERKLYRARAIVEDVNPKSVRVSLSHDVYVRDGCHYPKGHILRLPEKNVEPPPCWTARERELQILSHTVGLSDEDIRCIVEEIAYAWNHDTNGAEKTDENNFESVFAWIMLVNSSDPRGLTPDEQLWGYYELYVIGFRERKNTVGPNAQTKDEMAA